MNVIELLLKSSEIAAPVFPELLFLHASLRETIDGVGCIRIERIDIWIVGLVRVKAIGQQEVDGAGTVVEGRDLPDQAQSCCGGEQQQDNKLAQQRCTSMNFQCPRKYRKLGSVATRG